VTPHILVKQEPDVSCVKGNLLSRKEPEALAQDNVTLNEERLIRMDLSNNQKSGPKRILGPLILPP
jgi:hypothetical protein